MEDLADLDFADLFGPPKAGGMDGKIKKIDDELPENPSVKTALPEVIKLVSEIAGPTPTPDQVLPIAIGISDAAQAKKIANQEKAQFIFVVDGTGSMQPFMDSLQVIVRNLLADFTALFSKGFSINFVVYRDLADGPAETSATIVFPEHPPGFVPAPRVIPPAAVPVMASMDATMARMFRADGGDDTAEWLNSGLVAAIKGTQWDVNAATRMIMVFTDACNHGSQNYRGSYDDAHRTGRNSLRQEDPQQEEIRSLMQLLGADKKFYLSLNKLHHGPTPALADDQLEHMMTNWRSLCGNPAAHARFTCQDIPHGMTNPGSALVMAAIKRTIKDTATKSKTASVSGNNGGDGLDAITAAADLLGQKALNAAGGKPPASGTGAAAAGKGGRRSRSNVGRGSYNRAINKSVAKKLKRFISRKFK